jgi:NAD(P)-dependent dehydrogenase (short-subunit alcohol dehydrogenase family)
MNLGLRGKKALVTGASSGIGRATALALAAEGVCVALSARREAALEELAGAIRHAGGVACAFPADITEPAAPASVVREACTRFGALDILVNSAGGSRSGSITEVSDEDWEYHFQLKLMGMVRFIRAAASHITHPGGVIINVAGGSGERPNPNSVVNSVVNAGVLALTRAVAAGFSRQGVRVVAVNPGLTDTPLLDRMIAERAAQSEVDPAPVREKMLAAAPLGRFTTPEDVALSIAFIVSPLAGRLSGSVVDLGGSR